MRTRTTAAAVTGLLLALTACSSGSSEPDRHTAYVTQPPATPALGPDASTRTAYLAALNAIDQDIVHGKDDKAVDRGLNQCTSIKQKYERAKLISLTNSRFTSPNHPDGHGLAKAEKILNVVHRNLCPSF